MIYCPDCDHTGRDGDNPCGTCGGATVLADVGAAWDRAHELYVDRKAGVL